LGWTLADTFFVKFFSRTFNLFSCILKVGPRSQALHHLKGSRHRILTRFWTAHLRL
jgi:hypothetical protein